ncbi:putative calcium-binding protein CML45 [Heracleum sosnowskyi]|uniref:Calcium-binding protein CML45 n=1 Tax=Heracleum sosnowskyi TaxID=360622 RepID=A0AAD8H818_9APIA|nr:putative calcium-binding protein CML45 [Heracleum sosnowskyi]
MELKSLTKLALFFNVVYSDINVVKFLFKLDLFFDIFMSFISSVCKVVTLNSNCTASQIGIYDEKSAKKSSVAKEDISLVMHRLGISVDLDTENFDKFGNVEDVLALIDDNAGDEDDCVICLEDVRDAFDVFDMNKDGFIDEMELQRVLNALNIPQEDSTMVQCTRMINKFDDNGDGFIDFEEFFTLINNCF